MGAYERALSLTTMTSGRLDAAMVLSASQAIPPVSAPSPMTATTARRSSSPVSARALASPSAHERAVDAWLFSTTSCADSDRLG